MISQVINGWEGLEPLAPFISLFFCLLFLLLWFLLIKSLFECIYSLIYLKGIKLSFVRFFSFLLLAILFSPILLSLIRYFS